MTRQIVKKCEACKFREGDRRIRLLMICYCEEFEPSVQAPREKQYKVWCHTGPHGQGHYEYLMPGIDIPCRCLPEGGEKEKALLSRQCDCTFKKSKMYIWATVRPPGDIKQDIFMTKIRKSMFSSDFIKDGSWLAFEWKHNNQSNKGVHAHYWLDGDHRRMRAHIRRACKGWNCDFKTVPEDWYFDKIDYLNGITWDDEKSKMKSEQDSDLREKLGLETLEYKGAATIKKCVSTVSELNNAKIQFNSSDQISI